MNPNKNHFEKLYSLYNHRKYVHPDPLEFLYNYDNVSDIEIAGLIASCLAYGRVFQILKSVGHILDKMIPNPSVFLNKATKKTLQNTFNGFKHRFSDGQEISSLLFSAKLIIEKYGSIYSCIKNYQNKNDANIIPALNYFVKEIIEHAPVSTGHLTPLPEKGSACKRWFLYLRWMVRKDSVDPGAWNVLSPSKLIIPLDTHMYNISYSLKLTNQKQKNLKTAIQITEAFKTYEPCDPVKYDFALTRLGIRKDTDLNAFLNELSLTSFQKAR